MLYSFSRRKCRLHELVQLVHSARLFSSMFAFVFFPAGATIHKNIFGCLILLEPIGKTLLNPDRPQRLLYRGLLGRVHPPITALSTAITGDRTIAINLQ